MITVLTPTPQKHVFFFFFKCSFLSKSIYVFLECHFSVFDQRIEHCFRKLMLKVFKKRKIKFEKINLFAGRAVKRERRKGSSRRQQPAYGAAVNEVARELLRSARSPKRENGGRRYIKHDGMIASPVGSEPRTVLVSAVDSCHCPHPSHPSTALLPIAPLSLSDQVWCIQICDCVNCT